MAKSIYCVCCGCVLTMPQFFNGSPYGYTCILKVNPAQKQIKNKYVALDILKSDFTENSTRFSVLVSDGTKNAWLTGYKCLDVEGNTTLGVIAGNTVNLQLTHKGIITHTVKSSGLDFSSIIKSKKRI